MWVTSSVNGNVVEVPEDLARHLEAQGHTVSDTDPRVKPRPKK